MSLDAGNVKGRLDLDTTSFKGGFDEAHTHAETKGAEIREMLESIAEMATEIAGPAFGQLGAQIQSAFAGYSEGPIIGTLNAIAVVAGDVREAVQGASERFDEMGLAAEKAGVSVEFMSKLANMGSAVGLGVDQLGLGFKLLEEKAAEANDGNKEAQATFAKLGISATELAGLLQSPQQLIDRVTESIGKMTDASHRNLAAQELMGRGGMAIIPMLSMSAEETEHLAKMFELLHGNVSEAQAATGKTMAIMGSEFSAAMNGIEAAVSKPILDYLGKHLNEIEGKLVEFTNVAINTIDKAWSFIESESPEVQAAFRQIWEELDSDFLPILKKTAADAEALWPKFKEVGGALRTDFGPAFKELLPLLASAAAAFEGFEKAFFGHFLNGLHEAEPAIKRISDAITTLIGRITEGFQIVGSVTGYYDNPNDFLGGAAKSSRGTSLADARDQLGQAGALVKPAASAASSPTGNQSSPLGAAVPANHSFQQAIQQVTKVFNNGSGQGSSPDATGTADFSAIDLKPFLDSVNQTRGVFDALNPVVRDLRDGIFGTLNAFNAMQQRFESAGPSTSGGSESSPGQTSGGPQGPVYNVTVQPRFDHRESVNQLAARLKPEFERIRNQQQGDFAGAAQVAMAKASMGDG